LTSFFYYTPTDVNALRLSMFEQCLSTKIEKEAYAYIIMFHSKYHNMED